MTFQRIVVGVDFSTASLNAVRWVAGQFAPRARIFVVHVVPRMRTPGFLRTRAASVPDGAEAGSSLYPGLRVLADLAGARRSDVEILAGTPSTALARVATELNADLLCVGRTRKRRGSGRFGATTPQRLLSRTNLPVLIVPDSARLPPGAVLAAVSDGADGRDVLRAGNRLAAEWGVRLDALHALEPEVLSAVRGSRASTDEELCQLAGEWLASKGDELGPQPARFNAIARVGDAGEEAVAHAAREEIGLIVAGRRRHDDGIDDAGFDLGSTIRLITWAASCPVLVLGSPTTTAEATLSARSIRRPSRAASGSRLVVTAQRRVPTLHRQYRPAPGDGDDAA